MGDRQTAQPAPPFEQCEWWIEPLRYPTNGYRCTRNAGHGRDGKYCKQHGKKTLPQGAQNTEAQRMDDEKENPTGTIESTVSALVAAGWTDGLVRPKDGEFVSYLFEPFMRFYCGTYHAEDDAVAGANGFTTWRPEILVWHPLPANVLGHKPRRDL